MASAIEQYQETNGPAIQQAQPLRPIAKPDELIEVHQENVALITQVLEAGKDFGVIPGTGDKPTLLKPGAERLLAAFGTYADPVIIEREIDHNHRSEYELKKWEVVSPKPSQAVMDEMKAAGTGRFRKENDKWIFQRAEVEQGVSHGLYRYVVKANIVDRASGRIVASGIGACSSLESKYIRSPRDYENTILKMAKKRAMIDAVLNAFGLSDRFTQDAEDLAESEVSQAQKQPRQVKNWKGMVFGLLKELGLNYQNGDKAIVLEAVGTFLRRKVQGLYLKPEDMEHVANWLSDIKSGKRAKPPKWLKQDVPPGVHEPDDIIDAEASEVYDNDQPAPQVEATDEHNDDYNPFADE